VKPLEGRRTIEGSDRVGCRITLPLNGAPVKSNRQLERTTDEFPFASGMAGKCAGDQLNMFW
jgi:hypothetical protein